MNGENSSLVIAKTELASEVLAAQKRAEVESRIIIAKKFPRDYDIVRTNILKACARPAFAESALYSKPVAGKDIVGLSIRFVESAIQAMTNINVETQAIFDDKDKRIVRVTVIDIESNTSYNLDVTISKTVERKKVSPYDTVLSHRENTKGERVYLVEANEDQLTVKQNALISKAIRTLGLRLFPSDIADECTKRIYETMSKGLKEDPEFEKKKIIDSFTKIGVSPDSIKKYLKRDNLNGLLERELIELRQKYTAIKDGECTISEAFATQEELATEEEILDKVKEIVKASAASGVSTDIKMPVRKVQSDNK